MWQAGGGFAGTALAGMLGDSFFAKQARAADDLSDWKNPLAPKPTDFAPKARFVFFLVEKCFVTFLRQSTQLCELARKN